MICEPEKEIQVKMSVISVVNLLVLSSHNDDFAVLRVLAELHDRPSSAASMISSRLACQESTFWPTTIAKSHDQPITSREQ